SVRPGAWPVVSMNPFVADDRAVDRPELHRSGAAAPVHPRFQVVGVVAGELVALHQQIGDLVARLERVEAVLAVVRDAVADDPLPGSSHHRRTLVPDERGVLDRPAITGSA